jgi:hypothetical protein
MLQLRPEMVGMLTLRCRIRGILAPMTPKTGEITGIAEVVDLYAIW